MSYEDEIKAALETEAAQAWVPAGEILMRIKRSGARVRTASPWMRPRRIVEGVAVAAVVVALVALPQLRNWGGRPANGPESGPVASNPAGGEGPEAGNPAAGTEPAKSTPAPGPVTAYADEQLGFRLAFPTPFVGPKSYVQGALLFIDEKVQVTVGRRPRQPNKTVEDLLGDLVAANAKESQRLKPVDLGIRVAPNGRYGAYLHVTYISAAAWFDRETWVLPAGDYEYIISCGAEPGAQVPWDVAGPICESVMETVEVGTQQGFITRAQAIAAARSAVTGEFDASLAVFAEQYGDTMLDGVRPAWRVDLTPRDSDRVAYVVVVDARTGKPLLLHNMATDELKKLP